MVGADIWILRVDSSGAGNVWDAFASQHAAPSTAERQDPVVVSSSVTRLGWIISVKRSLIATEDADVSFSRSGGNFLVFSWGTSGPFAYHGENRVIISSSVNLLKTRPLDAMDMMEIASDAADAVRIKKYAFHALTMAIVFLCLVPSSILAQRFYPHASSARTYHRTSAVLSVSLVLPAIGQALTAGYGAVASGIKSVHLQVGSLVAAVLMMQVAMGMLSAHVMTGSVLPHRLYNYHKLVHRSLGVCMALLAMCNSGIGIYLLLGEIPVRAFSAYGIVLLTAILVLLSAEAKAKHGHWGCGVRRAARVGPAREFSSIASSLVLSVDAMTIAQVRAANSAGRKLVIYRDLIIDVSSFIAAHPGGAFALQAYLADDVSPLFAGLVSFSAHVAPHSHSMRARTLMLNMVLGALKSEELGFAWEGGVEPAAGAALLSNAHDASEEKAAGCDWVVAERSHASLNACEPTIRVLLRPAQGARRSVASAPREWRPASFGRYLIVSVPSDAVFEAAGATNAVLDAAALSSKAEGDRTCITRSVRPSRDESSRAQGRPSVNDVIPRSQPSQPVSRGGRGGRGGRVCRGPSSSWVDELQPDEEERLRDPLGLEVRSSGAFGVRSGAGIRRSNIRADTDDDHCGSSGSGLSKGLGAAPRPTTAVAASFVERPYSIVRVAGDDEALALYVKRYSRGSVSRALASLRVGQHLATSTSRGLGIQLPNAALRGAICYVAQGTGIVSSFDAIACLADRFFDLRRLELGGGDRGGSRGDRSGNRGNGSGNRGDGSGSRGDSPGSAVSLSLLACFSSPNDCIERKRLEWLHQRVPSVRVHWCISRGGAAASRTAGTSKERVLEWAPPPSYDLGAPIIRGLPDVTYGRLSDQAFIDAFPKRDFLQLTTCGRPDFVEAVRALSQLHGIPAASFVVV